MVSVVCDYMGVERRSGGEWSRKYRHLRKKVPNAIN